MGISLDIRINYVFFVFNINALICPISDDEYFTYLNPPWAKVLGGPLQEIMAIYFIEYVQPEDRELTIKTYQTILGGTNISNFRNRYRTSSGEYVWLQWFATPLNKYFLNTTR
jgi:PAS domain S-box-containing protein